MFEDINYNNFDIDDDRKLVEEKDTKSTAKSNGIYSINNGWIKLPEKKAIPHIDENKYNNLFEEWENKYFDIIEDNNVNNDKINDFIEDLYDLRKASIDKDGEYGLGNLVFKEFRSLGYLDNLKEIKREKTEKELSLEKLEETIDLDEATIRLNKFKSYLQNELTAVVQQINPQYTVQVDASTKHTFVYIIKIIENNTNKVIKHYSCAITPDSYQRQSTKPERLPNTFNGSIQNGEVYNNQNQKLGHAYVSVGFTRNEFVYDDDNVHFYKGMDDIRGNSYTLSQLEHELETQLM